MPEIASGASGSANRGPANRSKPIPIDGFNVVNTNLLIGALWREEARLPEAQVRRIVAAIGERCRDVEF